MRLKRHIYVKSKQQSAALVSQEAGQDLGAQEQTERRREQFLKKRFFMAGKIWLNDT
jgi:hypothetical protein